MKKSIKNIISMILVFTMVVAFSTTIFAASGFHKVNGFASETGANGHYYSTTTKNCKKITAQGTSEDSSKVVVITVQSNGPSGKLIASGVVTLDGKEVELNNLYTEIINPGTYYISITSSSNKAYEVSTFFYQ